MHFELPCLLSGVFLLDLVCEKFKTFPFLERTFNNNLFLFSFLTLST
ncbi:hypothetical protein LEP1GSC047_1706 [Leptospira inadai serovar Lyme str. 10]|uniref:Uncharacterized protein n=1 Tax=Leptospira inadai serovar Lyme str. 10 TaxID=1049790 RepID=V6HA77_9LEPT|nr:hypothetical protein LEP1GSC047_1706 [Leptospira inadai serovar Lyme str. 10]